MSMTIGTASGVNELQLQAMLTGQLKEATRLEGWEAFKNFFIKLLNHLPGMSLEDKEKNLRDIYHIIYRENTAGTSDKAYSIETLWLAVERLIHLMDDEHVRTMEFELFGHNVFGTTSQPHSPSRLNLVIRVDGHTLPEIALSNSVMHREMLVNVLTNNMIIKVDADRNGAPSVYQLDPEKLNSVGSSVKLASPAVIATRHGFNVSKSLEASRTLVQTQIKEVSNPDDQIAQLDQYQHHIANLTRLKVVPGVRAELHSEVIDNTLIALDTHRLQQVETYQRLNNEFADSLIEECANNLMQEGLLIKEAINAKISLLSMFTPHMDALFQETDRHNLQLIQSQLKLVYQMADLQEQFQFSETFPQVSFSNLQVAMKKADTGPLTTLLNTAFNAIRQFSPYNIAREELEAQAQQASGKLLQPLEASEAYMVKILNHPGTRPDADSKATERLVIQAKRLPPLTLDKAALISRAEILHQQNIVITKIEKYLSEALALGDRDVLDYPRGKIISELQTLNAQLPESQRKSNNQQQIVDLNEHLLRRKVDIWKERVGSKHESVISVGAENASQALAVLKGEVQQLNVSEKKKSELKWLISGLIAQHQAIEYIETTLHHYKETNQYANIEAINILSEKMKAIMDCSRKNALMEHINMLQKKNEELDLVNKELSDVDQKITSVARFQASWSGDLAIRLTNLKTQVQALSDGKPKEVLLRNVEATENKLPGIQNLEIIFSQTGELLAKATKTDGYSSQHWTQAFAQMKQAAAELKQLPNSPRKNGLATSLGNDTYNALNLLKEMIVASPEGDKKYISKRQKDYKHLLDFINSMADYLPNTSALTEVVKEFSRKKM